VEPLFYIINRLDICHTISGCNDQSLNIVWKFFPVFSINGRAS
jgi:hypothetical protein